jgi:hypothetical protein
MSKAENPFRYFKTSPEVIRLAVLLYVKYPLSLRNVEDLLAERGIDISHETVRSGGTGSVQFSQVTFAGNGSAACVASGSGAGTSTRCT